MFWERVQKAIIKDKTKSTEGKDWTFREESLSSELNWVIPLSTCVIWTESTSSGSETKDQF